MATLTKFGKWYYTDIRVKGKRIRRSLNTTNKQEALDNFKEKKEEILDEFLKKRIKFDDFCEQYLEWAWSSKPASTLREQQRLENIKGFFRKFDIVYLADIISYHIEQLKAYLKEKGKNEKEKEGLSKVTMNHYLQILCGMFLKSYFFNKDLRCSLSFFPNSGLFKASSIVASRNPSLSPAS